MAGSRVKPTPDPDVTPMFPNTMACTVTAVPDQFVQPLQGAVFDGSGPVPGPQHCLHGAEQLRHRVLWKGVAGNGLVDVLQLSHNALQGGDVELGHGGHPVVKGGVVEYRRERGRWAAFDDLAVGLDEASVGVPDEDGVAGGAQQTGQGGVAEPDVEDGVEHAWHGDGCAGSDGDEQWAPSGTEAQAGGPLDPAEHRQRRDRQRPWALCWPASW